MELWRPHDYSVRRMRGRTVVVGAGLAGLSCAFDLMRAGHDVVVLESGSRAGGVVGTVERDGFRFEIGPNTVQASSRAFRGLCGDLGIADRMIATDRSAGVRYLWFRGKLVALPRSPLGLVTTPLLSLEAKRTILSEPFRRFEAPPPDAPEPTFEQFLDERLGREATRLLAGSFVRGVYAAEIDELGARSAFPRMWGKAIRYHGLVRGLAGSRKEAREAGPMAGPDVPSSALVSFHNGLQAVVDALTGALGARVRLNRSVEAIERFENGWNVVPTGGAGVFAQRVVLAVPAPVAARLVATAVEDDEASRVLRGVRHARVTVVHLGFANGAALAGDDATTRGRDPSATSTHAYLPVGFGYLVPPDEDARGSIAPRALGTIFASNLFPDRAPRGGSCSASFYRGSDVERLDDAACAALACDDLRLVLGTSARPRPTLELVRRWSDVIPRYEPGHDARVRDLHAHLRVHAPGLVLAGSYTGGVSLDSVVARGREVARAIVREELHA